MAGMRSTIQTATCPQCGAPPILPIPQLTPWFCTDAECPILGWDPYRTVSELLMDALGQLIEERLAEE